MKDSLINTISSRIKWTLVILDIFFSIGLLVHSITFFVMNQYYAPFAETTDIQKRLMLRQMAESVFGFCNIVYIVGHIILACFLYTKRIRVSLRMLAFYYAVQIGIMLLCTIPFALSDSVYWGDYLFPVWGTAGTLLIVLSATFFALYFHCRETCSPIRKNTSK